MQGPDILQFFNNWQNQYADLLVDVTDISTALEAKYGPYLDYANAAAQLNGRFTAVPHTVYSSVFVVRKSYLKAAGTTRWPKTWDELRREGRKWKAAGYPIGQTLGHTFFDRCHSHHRDHLLCVERRRAEGKGRGGVRLSREAVQPIHTSQPDSKAGPRGLEARGQGREWQA